MFKHNLMKHALIIGGLVRLGRQGKRSSKVSVSALVAYFLAITTAITILAIPIALDIVNNHQPDNVDQLARTFGVGRDFFPAELLALASPISILLILALTLLALARQKNLILRARFIYRSTCWM